MHPDFKFNGISFDDQELREVAYSLLKEGEPYEREIGAFLYDWLDAKKIVAVQTSGSTGAPKTIELQKEQMVNSALSTGAFFELKAGHTALLCLPASYIAGKMMLVRAMVLGLHIDCIVPSSRPLATLEKNYDFCALVPLQLENSLQKIKQLRMIIVGGASLSKQLKEKVQQHSGVYETYGMTETITHVALKKVGGESENRGNLNTVKEQYANGFKALPNVRFSQDDRQCLVIDAPKVNSSLVVTNDIVELFSETHFEWLGRFDTIINSGGIKLIPEQLERKLAEFIEGPFFVAGLADEVLGQKLVLVLQGEVDSEALLRKITENSSLERYEIPKIVYCLPEFVRTQNGKIRRKETLKELQR